MAKVTLSKVTKRYDKKSAPAVKGIDLEVQDKEFMVLVGPSGCGKSTTLRMIAGLEEISDGTIDIGGRIVNDIPPKDRDIAMVFQNYALYPHMTVRENLAFGLKLRGIAKDIINQRVNEAAEILGIADYMDRKPKALSGGQRQRVAVGRAIVRKPAVFLFDEPLSNLDAKMRVQMRAEISKLHRRLDTTMIYVTHDQIEAMTMGDRICVMKDGIIQQVDTPLEIYDNPANVFVAGFIGTPPTNFFNGKLLRKGDGIYFHHSAMHLRLPAAWKLDAYVDKEVIFGLRPEHMGSELAEMQKDAQKIKAPIDVIEPMGAETYIYLNTGDGAPCVAKVDPHRKLKLGEEIELALLLDKAHIFDKDTEIRII